MSIYATVDDLRNSFEGDIAPEQEPKLQHKLDEAEEIVASVVRGGDIAAHIASGRTNANRVRIVLCNMVLRWLRNPSGSQTQTAGPFSQTLDKTVAAGKLFLTRDDRRLLGLRRGPVSVELVDDALLYPHRPPRRLEPELSNFSPEYFEDWP